MAQQIGVEIDCPFSPGMLKKVVHAGTQSGSFAEATVNLTALAEADVSRERVERWAKRIGQERITQVAALADAYQELPLPQRQIAPTCQVPQVACVQMDGGRIQIRERSVSPQNGDEKAANGHWRESLVGCLLSMTSDEHAEDPCPVIPKTFVDPQRMQELAREIKGVCAQLDGAEGRHEESPNDRPEKPKILVKSVIATRQGIDAFARKLVESAYRRGFSASNRKAFVADGAATNWSVHRQHFSHYVPILDFTHAVCYVWAAAMAGRSCKAAWSEYVLTCPRAFLPCRCCPANLLLGLCLLVHIVA